MSAIAAYGPLTNAPMSAGPYKMHFPLYFLKMVSIITVEIPSKQMNEYNKLISFIVLRISWTTSIEKKLSKKDSPIIVII